MRKSPRHKAALNCGQIIYGEAPVAPPPIDNLRAVVIIRGDPLNDLSPNKQGISGRAFAKHRRLVGEWQTEVVKCWEACGKPRFDIPVTVKIEVRRRRVMDPDNALAGLKHIIDGLSTRRLGVPGLFPDDSAKWVEYAPIVQNTGRIWAIDPHVVFLVIPRERKEQDEP